MDTTSWFSQPPFYVEQVLSLAERPLQGNGAAGPEAALLTGATPTQGAPGPAGNTPGVARGTRTHYTWGC